MILSEQCQSAAEPYRLVVLRQQRTELLLATIGEQLSLPWVEVRGGQRLAEALTTAMKQKWGCQPICLFMPTVALPPEHDTQPYYHVMECCDHAGEHDRRIRAVKVASLLPDLFSEPSDYAAISESLAQCESLKSGKGEGSFAAAGWFQNLLAWAQATVSPLGLRLSESFCQLNATPTFSLIRFSTDGAAVWFKAVGKPNLQEFSVTLALAELFPQYLPPILGTRPEWNGWLALEVPGRSLGESRERQPWLRAAAELASLQIDAIGKQTRLLAAGARDLRHFTLRRLLPPFFEVMAQLMERQSKSVPLPLARDEIQLLEEGVQDALSLTRELNIPDTIGHLDLNPGNILVAAASCTFLDWAEAYIGNPFFSFAYLQEHLRRSGAEPALQAQLRSVYAESWRSVIGRERLEEALRLAPLLAAFAYAAGSGAWSDEDKLRQSATAGYLRSLTRRMSREAAKLKQRRLSCPS